MKSNVLSRIKLALLLMSWVAISSACAHSDGKEPGMYPKTVTNDPRLVKSIKEAEKAEAQQEKPTVYLKLKEIFVDPQTRELAEAASHGNIKKIDELVQKGVDVNVQGLRGLTPLFSALMGQSKSGVRRLLELGANPNLLDTEGDAPIHIAAEMINDAEYLQLMLKHGGNPNLTRDASGKGANDGKAPLHLAMISDESDLSRETEGAKKIKLLLAAGADINLRDSWGFTPAMRAAATCRFDLVYLLLQSGADYTIKLGSGVTIVSLVKKVPLLSSRKEQIVWHTKVVQFLEDKGVDMNSK